MIKSERKFLQALRKEDMESILKLVYSGKAIVTTETVSLSIRPNNLAAFCSERLHVCKKCGRIFNADHVLMEMDPGTKNEGFVCKNCCPMLNDDAQMYFYIARHIVDYRVSGCCVDRTIQKFMERVEAKQTQGVLQQCPTQS